MCTHCDGALCRTREFGVGEGGDGRPVITLDVGETEQVIDAIEDALMTSNRGLFQRGGLVVAVGYGKVPTFDGRTIEALCIEERGDHALIEDMEAAATFFRRGKGGKLVRVAAPLKFARALKERRQRLRLR